MIEHWESNAIEREFVERELRSFQVLPVLAASLKSKTYFAPPLSSKLPKRNLSSPSSIGLFEMMSELERSAMATGWVSRTEGETSSEI